jgi:GT2 family glycosyltransferase
MHLTSVVFIPVNYNSDRETCVQLERFAELEDQCRLFVCVVDNTQRNAGDSLEIPKSQNVCVVRSPRNLGYFGGAAYGLSQYLHDHAMPDWVVVSNVDLLITDPQFLRKLAVLKCAPHMGAVAPRMHLYKWLYRSWLGLNAHELASAVFHRLRSAVAQITPTKLSPSRDVSRKIYAPHGSFVVLSKEYFRAGGSLDFPCFLFGEEIYLAESLRQLGLDVIYEPSLEVVHQEHKSTKLLKSRKLARFVASSAAYCADTYFPLKQAR